VGDVGAAIAATAAISGDLAAPAPVEAEVPGAAAPVPTSARAEPTMPTRPTSPPVTVQGYVRPPAKDVPGLIRAAVEPARPAVEPLFSNEGIFRQQKALRPSWKARILGPVTGVAVALRAAGTAFGHNAGIRLSSLEASLGSVPDRVRGSRISNGFSHFGDTRVFASIASAGLAVRVGAVWIGSALAVVLRRIILGMGRLISPQAGAAGRWVGSGWSRSPDSGEYGNPRRKRRVSPFWLLVPGCCLLVALAIGTNWVFSAATPASSDAPRSIGTTPTPYIAGGAASPTSAVRGSAGPGSSTGGGVSAKGFPSAGTSATPSGAPIPTPAKTPKPNPVPSPVPTPIHTPTPVITPHPTATLVPTPTPTPVMFATIVQATPPAAQGGDATFVVQSLPTATCTLTATGTAPGPGNSHTLSNITIGVDGSSGPVQWGGNNNVYPRRHAWAAGTYQVTATCTMPPPDNRSITSAAVSITMP
jgi:hypothetical protein